MHFYFSGTGNSLQAARAVAQADEPMYDMAACLRSGRFRFSREEGEAAGFVFPVYFGGLPSVVADFVSKLLIDSPPDYCYAVLTCGGSPAAAAEMLAKKLHARGIILHAAFPVTMPDNYVLMFRIDDEAKCAQTLQNAERTLAEISRAVARRAKCGIHVTVRDRLLTAGLYPSYVHGRRTGKFYADDKCVGCGVCAKRCPVGAIQMVNGRPKWVKARCAQCMACLRCNAVQYGKATKGRRRYVTPILKTKHSGH